MGSVQPGQTIGPYSIINQIGPAGPVTAFKAYSSALARDVILKVLSPSLAKNPELKARFEEAVFKMIGLTHPHILAVHDAGEIDGISYVALREAAASPLIERLAARSISLAEILRLMAQVAEALDYAHSQGVTHGALTPSSILVDSRGHALLTDFGLGPLAATEPSAAVYASPEQARGEPPGPRADTYALGILVYELLTGHAPAAGESLLSDALKRLADALPLPGHLRQEAVPALERIIGTAIAQEPSERFASPSDFVAAWRRAITPSPVPPPAAPAVAAGQPAQLSVEIEERQRRAVEAQARHEERRRKAADLRARLAESQREVAEKQEQGEASERERLAAEVQVVQDERQRKAAQLRAGLAARQREAAQAQAQGEEAGAIRKAQVEAGRRAHEQLHRRPEREAAEPARPHLAAQEQTLRKAQEQAMQRAREEYRRRLQREGTQQQAQPARQVVLPFRPTAAAIELAGRRARTAGIVILVLALFLCVGLPVLCGILFSTVPG